MHHVGPGEVGRPSRQSGKGREALPRVREGSEGPPGGPAGLESPSRRSGRLSQRSGNGQEGLPKVREALPRFGRGREGSRGHPGGPGVGKRPSQRFGRVRKVFQRSGRPSRWTVRGCMALTNLREGSRDPPSMPVGIRWPFWIFGEVLGGPPGGSGGVGRLSWRSGRGLEALPEV